ncbi:MAG: hypothetical protein KTR20_13255 [Cellvibrionaceae bacterium]|nr:hypothetical protein [Cellvibrionaceae bacterium]
MSNVFSFNKIISAIKVIFFTLLAAPGFAQKDADDTVSEADNESALIRLQSTFVGDKEQPSVSYFIPWKGTESPDGLRWRIKRKNDDTLGIVDRKIMLRSINIYDEMNFESAD